MARPETQVMPPPIRSLCDLCGMKLSAEEEVLRRHGKHKRYCDHCAAVLGKKITRRTYRCSVCRKVLVDEIALVKWRVYGEVTGQCWSCEGKEIADSVASLDKGLKETEGWFDEV